MPDLRHAIVTGAISGIRLANGERLLAQGWTISRGRNLAWESVHALLG